MKIMVHNSFVYQTFTVVRIENSLPVTRPCKAEDSVWPTDDANDE